MLPSETGYQIRTITRAERFIHWELIGSRNDRWLEGNAGEMQQIKCFK